MARADRKDNAARFATIGIAVVLIALAATVYFALRPPAGDDKFAMCRETKIAGGAGSIGGPFELTDETGARVTDADMITGPTLVYFGYTYCPDVCPLDGARNADAVAQLRDAGKPVANLFITIDPERDTPEALTEFTDYFDDEMIGLTGSADDITAVAKEYRAYFAKNGDGEDYLMDHSTFTYLMMPDTGLAEIIRRDTSAEDMAKTVACFVDNY